MNENSNYFKNIKGRTKFHYIKGLYPRFRQYLKHERARRIARKRGANIGENVVLPISLAKRANKNLIIGNNTSIQTDKIDLRCPVIVGSNVIIGSNNEIITASHNIDSTEWEHKYYGITIEDYVWIPTNILILPSCTKIEYGAVVGSGSVVVNNIESMAVVSGNPAKEFRKRTCVHSDLVVESVLGGDLKTYIKARK